MKKYLILSPYAKYGTRNSGDDLIIGSLVELLNHFAKNKIEYRVIYIAKSTPNKEKIFNEIDIKYYNALLIPGFRITIEGDEILDIRLKYIEKAIINNIPIFCIGSSWCCYPGIKQQTKYKIHSKEKALLKYIINDNKNCLTVRDKYTQLLLQNNNIDSEMTGDLALFDINNLFTKFKNNKINKIAISLPHNYFHYAYCARLKYEIQTIFGIEVKLVTHQYLKHKKDFKELIDLSGSYKNLDRYNEFDMHIGFRLHGHLWFLRNRSPSILIAEDGRGCGHLQTFKDLGIHAAPRYIFEIAKSMNQKELFKEGFDRNIRINIDSILNMLENEIKNNFKINKKTYKKIDELWNSKVKNIILRILEV